jgi:glycosyl transferase family 2
VGDAVRSALAQTHSGVRVIVVDDGSTDDSRELLRAFAPEIELILKARGGQASAVNSGFAVSTGDVVIFLDADDILHKDAAARVAAEFLADPNVTKVQYRMQVVDADGLPTGAVRPYAHTPLAAGDVSDAELTFPYDLPWPGMSANAFRAESLRRILPMPERPDGLATDTYLVHLTPLLGTVVSLDEVLGAYRVHGGNMYELQHPRLDLEHVRISVAIAAATTPHLEQLADELGIDRRPGPILSVSDLANRLVSRKLEPDLHPVPSDSVPQLAFDGIRAAGRRFDITWQMKFLLAGWFVLTAAAPRPLARRLASSFLFAETRPRLNRVLRRFHKWNAPRCGS